MVWSFLLVITDGWTSRTNHSYAAHTVHYVDRSLNLHSHLLDTSELSLEHTSVNLACELETTFNQWDLQPNKLVATTTDNAKNIVNAIDRLDWLHFGCFAHTLQLGVKKAMDVPQIAKALARGKHLVSHFHHSAKSSSIVRQKQINLHCNQLSLVQDVTPRWKNTWPATAPLCYVIRATKTDLLPSDTQIKVMDVFMEVMKPLVEVTEVMGGKNKVTISAVRPLLYKIIDKHLLVLSSDDVLKKLLNV